MILTIFRVTDQIIYVKDPPPLLREKFCITTDSSALENISSRLNSIRNTSIDVTSILSEGNYIYFNIHNIISTEIIIFLLQPMAILSNFAALQVPTTNTILSQ